MRSNQSTAYNLLVITLRLREKLAELCEPYSITSMQGLVLILLDPDRTMSMNELSEVLGCDASNCTGLIDRLESHKLIERSSDEHDRRVKMISLTKQGARCRGVLLKGLEDLEALNISRLTSVEKDQFQKILEKLTD